MKYIVFRKDYQMSIRRMEYNKNGLDMRCRVEGSGEYSRALILVKAEGSPFYIVIGKIYKTKNLNWTHQKGVIPMVKQSWHDAAKKLYAVSQEEAA